ncbi:MAG: hypothetical protein CL912_07010 [Deltaproteobacteria bacterium]|nr:hypothetical protein [Deltaproteobacteria bacterium]
MSIYPGPAQADVYKEPNAATILHSSSFPTRSCQEIEVLQVRARRFKKGSDAASSFSPLSGNKIYEKRLFGLVSTP